MQPPRRFMPAKGPPRPSARERVLAMWRGQNLAPAEKAARMSARRSGDVLPRVLAELRLDRRLAEAEIVRTWNSLIDPVITAHAQPDSLARGTLFVNVDSSPWLDEIVRYRRREILERLQHAFGREKIQRISFRVAG